MALVIKRRSVCALALQHDAFDRDPDPGHATHARTMPDGKVTIEDENGGVANVTIADVDQSNGVIHVIDKVLLPKM